MQILVSKKDLAEYILSGKVPATWSSWDGHSSYSDTLIEYTISPEKLREWRQPTNEQVGPKVLLKG